AEDCALSMDATGVSRILSGGGLEYLNLSRGKRKGDGLAAIGLGLASNLKILDFVLGNGCKRLSLLKITNSAGSNDPSILKSKLQREDVQIKGRDVMPKLPRWAFKRYI
ncbi:hypothetical protein Tco_1272990, partial [Tanacetum coccineum]